MIKISGNEIKPEEITNQYPPGSTERIVFDILHASSHVYTYDSIEQLKFELTLRKNIVNAAKALNKSNFSFRVFRKSICNPEYWHRTDEGGFELLPDVKPSDAINDIFKHSSLYGTECATAMVIIYYKAMLDTIPEDLFNQLYSEIYLMNWQHLDKDLGIVSFEDPDDFMPGDCRYFKNPEVDPLTPEWQGENVFDLGNGLYYGHGIGIGTAEKMIHELNENRINGATESAYLTDYVNRPNFKYLFKKTV